MLSQASPHFPIHFLKIYISLSHHIPPRPHPPQQPIPHHRLHRTPQVFGHAEQLARLHRAEAFGILLEQRDNTPAHVAAWCTRHGWGARSWRSRRRRAGHVEQALTLLLRLLQHVQQERFTLPRGLLALQGRLFAAVRGLQLATQQITLQAQQVAFLVHDGLLLCFCGWSALLRATGAGCCILERSRGWLLRAPLERVACTQQFRGVDMAVRINAQAAGTDGAVQGGARDTCYTRRITNGELGHGVAFQASRPLPRGGIICCSVLSRRSRTWVCCSRVLFRRTRVRLMPACVASCRSSC